MTQGTSVTVREYDGGREVEMAKLPGLVVLEAGEHAYAFDSAIFLHQVKKLFGLAIVVTEAVVMASVAIPEP